MYFYHNCEDEMILLRIVANYYKLLEFAASVNVQKVLAFFQNVKLSPSLKHTKEIDVC